MATAAWEGAWGAAATERSPPRRDRFIGREEDSGITCWGHEPETDWRRSPRRTRSEGYGAFPHLRALRALRGRNTCPVLERYFSREEPRWARSCGAARSAGNFTPATWCPSTLADLATCAGSAGPRCTRRLPNRSTWRHRSDQSSPILLSSRMPSYDRQSIRDMASEWQFRQSRNCASANTTPAP